MLLENKNAIVYGCRPEPSRKLAIAQATQVAGEAAAGFRLGHRF